MIDQRLINNDGLQRTWMDLEIQGCPHPGEEQRTDGVLSGQHQEMPRNCVSWAVLWCGSAGGDPWCLGETATSLRTKEEKSTIRQPDAVAYTGNQR